MTDDSSSVENPRGTAAGLALLIGGTAAIGAAYAAAIVLGAAPEWAPWALVLGASATPVGLFVVGAATRGSIGRGTAILLAILGAIIFGAFALALTLPSDEGPAGEMFFGLPRRLAIVFYGVGLLPLFVLPVAFARTWGREGKQ